MDASGPQALDEQSSQAMFFAHSVLVHVDDLKRQVFLTRFGLDPSSSAHMVENPLTDCHVFILHWYLALGYKLLDHSTLNFSRKEGRATIPSVKIHNHNVASVADRYWQRVPFQKLIVALQSKPPLGRVDSWGSHS
jgi:hypothetical protein